jgi:ribosome biogenesis GTPase A
VKLIDLPDVVHLTPRQPHLSCRYCLNHFARIELTYVVADEAGERLLPGRLPPALQPIQTLAEMTLSARRVSVAFIGHKSSGKSSLVGRLLCETDSVSSSRQIAVEQQAAKRDKRGAMYAMARLNHSMAL